MDVRPGMEIEKHEAHKAWRAADRIRRLSDRLVGIGPFGLGLDGVLAWVPGVGSFYSVAAGGLLVFFGVRSKASMATLARMVAYIAANTGASAVPVVGWAADTLFPGHLMAARALQKDIEARHGPPPEIAGQGSRKRVLRRRLRKPPAAAQDPA